MADREDDDDWVFPDANERSADPEPSAAPAVAADDDWAFEDANAHDAAPTSPAPTPGPDAHDEATAREDAKGYDRDWIDELGRSATSYVAGASGNLLDEALGAGNYLAGKVGIRPESTWDEAQSEAGAQTSPMVADYPAAHMAGGATLGAAVAPAGGASAAGQAGLGALLGAGTEYADSRSLGRSAAAGAVGGALGFGGAKLGNWAARNWARTPTEQHLYELELAGQEARGLPPPVAPDPKALPLPEGPPRPAALPEPAQYPPAYQPPAAAPVRTAPTVPVGGPDPAARPPLYGPFPEGPPRPDLGEMGPGYAPQFGEPNAQPLPGGPPAPQPMPPPGQYPPPGGPKVIRGTRGKFAPVTGTLDMPAYSPPAPATYAEAAPAYQAPEYLEHAALESLDKGAMPRTGGPPMQLDELLRPEYQLGDLEPGAGTGARLRGGSTPTRDAYALGDVEAGAREAAKRGAAPRGNRLLDETPAPYEGGELEAITAPGPRAESAIEKANLGDKIAIERIRATGQVPFGDKFMDKALALGGALVPGGRRLASAGRLMLRDSHAVEGLLPDPAVKLYANDVARRGTQQIAYAGAPSVSHALQGLLSSGQTGLMPDEEKRLTAFVVKGDKSSIASEMFRLKMKHPGFAKGLEDWMKSQQTQKD